MINTSIKITKNIFFTNFNHFESPMRIRSSHAVVLEQVQTIENEHGQLFQEFLHPEKLLQF